MRSSAATSKVTAGDVWDFNPFNPFNCHERRQKMIIVSIEWVTTSCHTFVTPLKRNDDVAEFSGDRNHIKLMDIVASVFSTFVKCLSQPRLRSNMQTPTSKTPRFFSAKTLTWMNFKLLRPGLHPRLRGLSRCTQCLKWKKNAGIQRLKHDHCHHCLVFALSSAEKWIQGSHFDPRGFCTGRGDWHPDAKKQFNSLFSFSVVFGGRLGNQKTQPWCHFAVKLTVPPKPSSFIMYSSYLLSLSWHHTMNILRSPMFVCDSPNKKI